MCLHVSKLLTVIEELQSLAWNFMRTKQDHIGKLPILIPEMFTRNDVLQYYSSRDADDYSHWLLLKVTTFV